ncbi:MAG: hypothetical protein KC613_19605 [Myxococcales bacterium]|nr:hypothetical protein [Myxococcales bacterium]MCB9526457.1 glycerol acyltransferase [Myxococcales bacterium]
MLGAPLDIDDPRLRDDRLIERLSTQIGPWLARYFRADVRGLENLPAGAALLVGNHSGGMATPDSFTLGAAICARHGVAHVPYGLAHQAAIKAPGINPLLVRLGGVRACHENAGKVFALGRKVLVYPGGDVDAYRPWGRRDQVVFGGRRGYIRLALRHGVPVVPVVSDGGHAVFRVLSDGRRLARWLRVDRTFRLKVLPVTLSVPWGLTVGPVMPLPPPVRITTVLLPPVAFDRAGAQAAADDAYVAACAQRVEGLMQATLARLAAERRG